MDRDTQHPTEPDAVRMWEDEMDHMLASLLRYVAAIGGAIVLSHLAALGVLPWQ